MQTFAYLIVSKIFQSNIEHLCKRKKINFVHRETFPNKSFLKKYIPDFNSKEIIIVGHSGGAAITGILFGRFKNIVNEAILISCPCIVPLWRKNYAEQLSLKNKKRIC